MTEKTKKKIPPFKRGYFFAKIGSGQIVIGQAYEFDYSGTQACKALCKLGYEIVLVNSNPATIMTDPGMADVTYIEPLNLEISWNICKISSGVS